MTDTVIFDLDGTLLNTLEDLADSLNYVLGKFGLPLRTIEEVRHFVGNGAAKLIERVIPDGKGNPVYGEILQEFKDYYALHCQNKTKPYDGIMPMLDELCAKGYQLAIVSNKFDAAVKKLNRFYFGERIKTAIGESEKVKKKPAPDTVYRALEELGANVSQAVYVGDSEVDIETAANASMPCISVTWGFRDRGMLLGAGAAKSHIITSPTQLLSVLHSLSAEA